MPNQRSLLLIAIIPALIVGVLYEMFLGHRHDYVGHFLAGYGATLAAGMLSLRVLPAESFEQQALCWLVPFCLLCIGGGAILELTAFRLARFDEIDFCNQSLGAVLAVACGTAYVTRTKLPLPQFDYALIAGIAFVGVGACYAVA